MPEYVLVRVTNFIKKPHQKESRIRKFNEMSKQFVFITNCFNLIIVTFIIHLH